MGATSEINPQMIGAVLFGLFMFGIAFNGLVDWLGERKDGYVSLLVVAGVLITLLAVALIDWKAAALCLAAFVASGLPMILGDIGRTIRKREAHLRLMRLVASDQARDHEA